APGPRPPACGACVTGAAVEELVQGPARSKRVLRAASLRGLQCLPATELGSREKWGQVRAPQIQGRAVEVTDARSRQQRDIDDGGGSPLPPTSCSLPAAEKSSDVPLLLKDKRTGGDRSAGSGARRHFALIGERLTRRKGGHAKDTPSGSGEEGTRSG
ncbi:hypothetical protein THAOC_22786, partial [Thalassiosira oceanica]